MDPSLLQAYQSAVYIVCTNEGFDRQIGDQFLALKVGQNNAHLDEFFSSIPCSTAAFITAYNPRSKRLSKRTNKERNDSLKAMLHSRKLAYLEGYSTDHEEKWPREESFLILSITEEEATAIGRTFEQNAYLWLESGKPVELKLVK